VRISGLKRFRAFGVLALVVLAGCASQQPGEVQNVPPKGAVLEAQVFLSARGPDLPNARFDLPSLNAAETRVALVPMEPRAMAAAIECDGPARLHVAGAGAAGLFMRPGAARSFNLPSRHEPIAPMLVLPTETTRCNLTWGDGNSLDLVRENGASPAAARIGAQRATCPPYTGPDDALAKAFFAERDLAQTCPRPTGAFALYPDEIEALQLRLERLTGAPVPRAALEQGDPEMALDFSQAPRFDEIVVSYLQVRADVSGYLTARALAFHAARGTKVRMIAHGPLTVPTDRRLFGALAAKFPNFQIQYFDYHPRGFAPLRRLKANVMNAHHMKVFAATSAEPGASFALVGGRNLHDGFFFPSVDELGKLPFLIDYDAFSLNPLQYFNKHEDFEIGLFDRHVVADVVAHFDQFWNRDAAGAVMARNPAPARTMRPAGQVRDGLVRHFISLPWADGQAQESLFVDLFDAAEREIIIISPFVYPTRAIDSALLRAAERGVKVRLLSRYVGEEPPSIFVNSMNADYADRRRDVFSIGAYEPSGGLTSHLKLFVVDERLAIVTSTNLNRRSFVGDSENGLVFLDSTVARGIHAQLEQASNRARPFPPDFPTLWLGRLFDGIPFLVDLL